MGTSKTTLSYDPEDFCTLLGSDSITFMYEHTDKETGILYIPEWPYDNGFYMGQFYKCRMNWNRSDLENALSDYENLLASLKKISEVWDEPLDSEPDKNALTKDLRDVWDKYVLLATYNPPIIAEQALQSLTV